MILFLWKLILKTEKLIIYLYYFKGKYTFKQAKNRDFENFFLKKLIIKIIFAREENHHLLGCAIFSLYNSHIFFTWSLYKIYVETYIKITRKLCVCVQNISYNTYLHTWLLPASRYKNQLFNKSFLALYFSNFEPIINKRELLQFRSNAM